MDMFVFFRLEKKEYIFNGDKKIHIFAKKNHEKILQIITKTQKSNFYDKKEFFSGRKEVIQILQKKCILWGKIIVFEQHQFSQVSSSLFFPSFGGGAGEPSPAAVNPGGRNEAFTVLKNEKKIKIEIKILIK
jgi:hypothetical protein